MSKSGRESLHVRPKRRTWHQAKLENGIALTKAEWDLFEMFGGPRPTRP